MEDSKVQHGFSDNPAANKAHYDVLRCLTTTHRLRQGMLLSQWNREMMLERIREDHPEFSDEDVKLAYFRQIMTETEFATLFPEDVRRFPASDE